jgi:hypothetical protein
MKRRVFVKSTVLVGISAVVLPQQVSALNSLSSESTSLYIDLGSIRIQDVLGNNSYLPSLMNATLLNFREMHLNELPFPQQLNGVKENKSGIIELSHANTDFSYSTSNLYDIILLEKGVELLKQKNTDVLIKLSNSDIAHSSYNDYLNTLRLLDSKISQIIKQELDLNKINVCIYSSSGRNLECNEWGGLDHCSNDLNTERVFMLTNQKELLSFFMI